MLEEERRSYTATLLLAFFLGELGIHRFYTGHVGIGVAQLLTGGGCGIWKIIDFILICFNNYRDANGNELEDYNPTLGRVMFFVWLALFIFGWYYFATIIAEMLKYLQGV